VKKTISSITFNKEEIEIIKSALYKAFEFEKEKSHLFDADMYLRMYNEVKNHDVKKSQRNISATTSKE
jgi:light-regulated signal transduction histidine kinase (bacteriophytochrome)